MTTKPMGERPNPARTRAAALRRQATGLSLGVLLASFGAVAMTGAPVSATDPLNVVLEGPPAPAADVRLSAAGATAPAASQQRVRPAPPSAPRAQQPRRVQTRES